MLDDDVTVDRSTDVTWRTAAGYLVVATLDDKVYEAADPAPAIWRAIERPISISELVSLLAEEYAATPEQIRNDVLAFLCELVAAGSVVAHG